VGVILTQYVVYFSSRKCVVEGLIVPLYSEEKETNLGYPCAFCYRDQKMLYLRCELRFYIFPVRFHDYLRAIVHVTTIRLRE